MAAATTQCAGQDLASAVAAVVAVAGFCAAELRSRRGLPVRLEPRVRAPVGCDDQGEGGAHAALLRRMQLSESSRARARRWCSRRTNGPVHFFAGVCRRGIYATEDGSMSMVFVGKERAYFGAFWSCAPTIWWSRWRAVGCGLGRGRSRGRPRRPRPPVRAHPAGHAPFRDQRVADGSVYRGTPRSGRIRRSRASTVWQSSFEQRPFLMAFAAPSGFHATEVAVSKTCLVRFDNNSASPPVPSGGRSTCGPTPIGSSSARTARLSPSIPAASGDEDFPIRDYVPPDEEARRAAQLRALQGWQLPAQSAAYGPG